MNTHKCKECGQGYTFYQADNLFYVCDVNHCNGSIVRIEED